MNGKETPVKIINDHWVVLVFPILFFVIAWAFFFLLLWFAPNKPWDTTDYIIFLSEMSLWMLLHHWFFVALFRLILSAWVITPTHVFSFEIMPLFKSDVDVIEIQRIFEIEERQEGIIKRLLNYGEVQIHTIYHPKFKEFVYIPDPKEFVMLIQEMKNRKQGGS